LEEVLSALRDRILQQPVEYLHLKSNQESQKIHTDDVVNESPQEVDSDSVVGLS
jgi:hypothetical protein